MLEDTWSTPLLLIARICMQLSVSPEGCAGRIGIRGTRFRERPLRSVNGEKLTPLGVMQKLNKLGGKAWRGTRWIWWKNRFVGMKSRLRALKLPAAPFLHFAHRQMESITMDREVMHLRDRSSSKNIRPGIQRLPLVRRSTRGAAGARDRITKERHPEPFA